MITICLSILALNCCNIPTSKVDLTTLPSDSLINQVIFSVIKLDSLNRNYHIGNRIFTPIVYSFPLTQKDLDSPPPPPPPQNHYGYSFEVILRSFDSRVHTLQRIKDSLFILKQVDTTLNYKLLDYVNNLFEKNIDETYYFSVPVFSTDKSTVIIQYNMSLFSGYRTCLIKKNNIWTRLYHDNTWMR